MTVAMIDLAEKGASGLIEMARLYYSWTESGNNTNADLPDNVKWLEYQR